MAIIKIVDSRHRNWEDPEIITEVEVPDEIADAVAEAIGEAVWRTEHSRGSSVWASIHFD